MRPSWQARYDRLEEATVSVGRCVTQHVACQAARFHNDELRAGEAVAFRSALLRDVSVAEAAAVEAELCLKGRSGSVS